MSEQTADKQTPPPGGFASAQPAAGTAPAEGVMTTEQLQAYLDKNPDAAKGLHLKAKVDGEEMPVRLADLQTSYQLESTARRRLETAALKEKALDAREAELADKGDPRKAFEDVLQSFARPQTTPDPFSGLDSQEALFTEGQKLVGITRGLYSENQRLTAENKAIADRQTALEKRTQEMEQAQTSVFQWTRTKEDFDGVRQQSSEFTARVTVKPDGTFGLDLGDNPVVTAEVLRLKQSDMPDSRFGGAVPKTLSYAELAKGVQAAEDARYEGRKVAAEKKHQETLRASAGMATPATGAIEIPSNLIDLPTDSKEEIMRKAVARGDLIREKARALGAIIA